MVVDVGLGRSVFRRVIVGKLGARPQGCGVPGWVGPGRKGWILRGPPPLLRPILHHSGAVGARKWWSVAQSHPVG